MNQREAAKNLQQFLNPIKGFENVAIGHDNDLLVYYNDEDFLDHKYVAELEEYRGYPLQFVKR